MGGLFGDGTLGAEGGHGDVGASQAGVGRVRATVPSIAAALPKKMNHTTHENSSKLAICKMQSSPVSTIMVTFVQVDFSFKILRDGSEYTCSFETKVIQIEVRFDERLALVKRLLGGAIGWTWAWV